MGSYRVRRRHGESAARKFTDLMTEELRMTKPKGLRSCRRKFLFEIRVSGSLSHWNSAIRIFVCSPSSIFYPPSSITMGLLDDIEPLKQSALADLKAAPDLAALEQTKGNWTGPHGKFTALMKQLGTLSKEEKPAAGN